MKVSLPSRRVGKTVVSEARTRKMRAILAACRRIGLDSDARKELQEELTGVASMADMTEHQLGQLLDHLNRDYKGTNPERRHIAKIKALWWSLYWLGAVQDPSDKALSSFVKRQTGISALRFLDHSRSFAVIEALKSWLAREGVKWPSDDDVEAINASWKIQLGHDLWDRWAVLNCLTHRLYTAGIIRIAGHDYARLCLDLPGDRWQWSARQLDDVIRLLGKKWRAERPGS